jgi:hypothetical protein
VNTDWPAEPCRARQYVLHIGCYHGYINGGTPKEMSSDAFKLLLKILQLFMISARNIFLKTISGDIWFV